jgi:hypothetical protein
VERLYSPSGDEKIVDWRLLCFLRLGFSQLDASALAVRRDVDRHFVEHRLIRRGCPPRLAMEVLL